MKFRLKDLEEVLTKKPNWKKVVDLLNKKSFETILEDKYLEVDILSNRFADAGNIIGLAQEISTLTGIKLKPLKFKFKEINKKYSDFITIECKTQKCLNYFGRVILEVQNSSSPKWLKEFVEAYGLNSINLLVDLSNYVMIKFGAPLHIFDLDKIENSKIIIREAKEKEIFTSLKEENYNLPKDSIVIADPKKILALAGIQGAKFAEVTLETKNIFIEAAIFDPASIYKTSRMLNLQTQASYRFERKVVDINSLRALENLTYLIHKYAKGKVAKKYFQLKPLEKPKKILLRYQKIFDYLGFEIDKKEIEKILYIIGCTLIKKTAEYVYVNVPIERLDLTEEVDLIEEVIRILGYDKIEIKFPTVHKISSTAENYQFATVLKKELQKIGLNEVMTYNFIDDNDLNNFVTFIKEFYHKPIEILNPVSNLYKYYRPFIFINHLKVINKNLSLYNWLRTKNIYIFEIGKIGGWINKKINEEDGLCISITSEDLDKVLIDSKSILSYIANFLGLKKFHITPSKLPKDEFDVFGYIHTEEEENLGFIGLINKNILTKYEIDQPVLIIEVRLNNLMKYYQKEKLYEHIPVYPAILRDISIIVPEYIQSDIIEDEIYNVAKDLLEDIELFDIYQGAPLKENEKSIAYHLIFRSGQRTLTEEEVNYIMEQIIKRLKEKFGAIIR